MTSPISRRSSIPTTFAGTERCQASSSICCFEQAFSLGQRPNAFKRLEHITARITQRRIEKRRFAPDELPLLAEPKVTLCIAFSGCSPNKCPRFGDALKLFFPASQR